jgi:hypothetical protein
MECGLRVKGLDNVKVGTTTVKVSNYCVCVVMMMVVVWWVMGLSIVSVCWCW